MGRTRTANGSAKKCAQLRAAASGAAMRRRWPLDLIKQGHPLPLGWMTLGKGGGSHLAVAGAGCCLGAHVQVRAAPRP
jgi:hypothetical protein